MRIAFFVKVFPAKHESFITNQLRGLLTREISVDVLSQRRGSTPSASIDPAQYNLFYRSRSVTNQVRAARNLISCYFSGTPLRRQHCRDATLFQSGQEYDLIHCQYATLGTVAIQLRRAGIFDAPIVTSVRGFDLIAINAEERRLLRQSELCLPVCSAFQDRLKQYGVADERIAVLRSGLDLTRFSSHQPGTLANTPVRFLTVARLVEKKGVEYAIRAVAKLTHAPDQQTPFRYVIIGDGPLRKELEQLTRRLNVDHQVEFLGWLPHEQVLEQTRQSQIVVNPSVTTSDGTQEGIPNSLKEAMAYQIPVVGTRHSGIPELIDHGISGYLVPERDVDSLTSVLAQLLASSKLRRKFGKEGRKRVEQQYDINRLTDELISCYRGAIESYDSSRNERYAMSCG